MKHLKFLPILFVHHFCLFDHPLLLRLEENKNCGLISQVSLFPYLIFLSFLSLSLSLSFSLLHRYSSTLARERHLRPAAAQGESLQRVRWSHAKGGHTCCRVTSAPSSLTPSMILVASSRLRSIYIIYRRTFPRGKRRRLRDVRRVFTYIAPL